MLDIQHTCFQYTDNKVDAFKLAREFVKSGTYRYAMVDYNWLDYMEKNQYTPLVSKDFIEIIKWTNENIFMNIDLNTMTTEHVLLNIAKSRIRNLNIPVGIRECLCDVLFKTYTQDKITYFIAIDKKKTAAELEKLLHQYDDLPF